MQKWHVRGAIVALAIALVGAACGDDGVLGGGDTTAATTATTETTAPVETTEAPPETTEVPETTQTTVATTTTLDEGARCSSQGGVFAAQEGPDGICFPGDEIATEAYVIRKVDLDDPDGGLRVWSGPGAPGSKVPQEDKYVEVGVIPILLGEGIPLLPAPSVRAKLRLVSSRVYETTGTVMLEYAVEQGSA